MRSYSRVLTALFIVALIAIPGTLLSQQLAVPMEKTLPANVSTTINYAGQTLVFAPTNVTLRIKLQMVSLTEIELRVQAYPNGGSGTSGNEYLQICWEQENECIYDDVPPNEEWVGGLYTEGGWTEK